MPTQNIHVLTGVVSLEELCEVVAKLQKQVRYLQNKGIDSENCREIGGWQVSEETLQALDGDVGMSTADDAPDPVRLWAGSVSKETAPWRVHKSGFGVATGWRIQSRDGAYPYVVMDPQNDLFGAYLSATQYIQIVASLNGTPVLDFVSGSNDALLFFSPGSGFFITTTDRLRLSANNGIYLGSQTNVNFSNLINTQNGQSLQGAINSKANIGVQTSSFTGGAHNHGIPDGTQLMTASGGVVTWVSYGGFTHSHTQQ